MSTLITKHQNEGKSGVIRKIQINEHSFDIVLFSEMSIKNIANFCCNDIPLFRSPLCFDFTFDLGKDPPFFAFVGTYKNTSVYSKGTTVGPVMLGPILICHKKNETSVQLLCEELVKACEGLGHNVQVLSSIK